MGEGQRPRSVVAAGGRASRLAAVADAAVQVGLHAGASLAEVVPAAAASVPAAVAVAVVARSAESSEHPIACAWLDGGSWSSGAAGMLAAVRTDHTGHACLPSDDRAMGRESLVCSMWNCTRRRSGYSRMPMADSGTVAPCCLASSSRGGVPTEALHADVVRATNFGRERHAALASWVSSRKAASVTGETASPQSQSMPRLLATSTLRRRTRVACALAAATPWHGAAVSYQRW